MNDQEFNKRYDKFKKNNLPTPFFDKERNTLEYVSFHNNTLNIYNTLDESLGKLTNIGLYYPFNSKYFIYTFDSNKKRIIKEKIGHNHEYSFEEVLSWLYDFPESFKIQKKDEIYYSKQQLEYIKRVKNFLLFIGLKDRDVKIKVDRYRNDFIKNYYKFYILKYSNKDIKDYISGKRNYLVRKYTSEDKKYHIEDNLFVKRKLLIVNEKEQYKLMIQVDHYEVKKYKDIKKVYKNSEYKNETELLLAYFNIIDIY